MARSFSFIVSCCLFALAGCASSQKNASPGMFEGDNVVTFQVEGMACRNCANEIARELEELPGVRAAMIDFDTKTAKVALEPTNGATMDELKAAVEHWRVEHFGQKDDPNCLDPARRAELQKQMQSGAE